MMLRLMLVTAAAGVGADGNTTNATTPTVAPGDNVTTTAASTATTTEDPQVVCQRVQDHLQSLLLGSKVLVQAAQQKQDEAIAAAETSKNATLASIQHWLLGNLTALDQRREKSVTDIVAQEADAADKALTLDFGKRDNDSDDEDKEDKDDKEEDKKEDKEKKKEKKKEEKEKKKKEKEEEKEEKEEKEKEEKEKLPTDEIIDIKADIASEEEAFAKAKEEVAQNTAAMKAAAASAADAVQGNATDKVSQEAAKLAAQAVMARADALAKAQFAQLNSTYLTKLSAEQKQLGSLEAEVAAARNDSRVALKGVAAEYRDKLAEVLQSIETGRADAQATAANQTAAAKKEYEDSVAAIQADTKKRVSDINAWMNQTTEEANQQLQGYNCTADPDQSEAPASFAASASMGAGAAAMAVAVAVLALVFRRGERRDDDQYAALP